MLPENATTELAPGVDPENPKRFNAAQLAEKSVYTEQQQQFVVVNPSQQVAQAAGVQTPQMNLEQKAMLDAIDALAAKGVDEATIQALREKNGLGNGNRNGNGAAVGQQLVQKTSTDPVVILQPYTAPSDFDAQYPQPLDPLEILDDCEEIAVWKALPEHVTPYNAHQWREMTSIDFATATGLTNDGFFAKGGCPDRITATGENKTVTHKYIGAQQTLAFEDIKHSAAVAAIAGLGIQRLLHHTAGGPDVIDAIRDAKAKEIKKQEILVMNNWDLALVKGDSSINSLAFDGIEVQVVAGNGARVNADNTGTFDIEEFDNFLVAGCARPTAIFGHPKALESVKKGYMALAAVGGTQPVQMITMTKDAGGKVIPGVQFADMVDTSVGRILLVPDFRFTTTQVADHAFVSTLYALRMKHNGEDLVFKSTQTPLVFKDLQPGCTAISFMVYAVTALVVKHMCAQAAWTSQFEGRPGTGCDLVAGNAIGNN